MTNKKLGIQEFNDYIVDLYLNEYISNETKIKLIEALIGLHKLKVKHKLSNEYTTVYVYDVEERYEANKKLIETFEEDVFETDDLVALYRLK